jgi:hypothetical protein
MFKRGMITLSLPYRVSENLGVTRVEFNPGAKQPPLGRKDSLNSGEPKIKQPNSHYDPSQRESTKRRPAPLKQPNS